MNYVVRGYIESEKILKKKYNSAQLKIYQQRQEHPAAGSDENACI